MLCCTSAPPTTSIARSRASTGHVVGATKQTCGRAPVRGATLARARASGRVGDGISSYIAPVDVLEVRCRLLYGGVGPQPSRLLGGDRLALGIGEEDRARERIRRACRDYLAGARQDVADVGVIRARDRNAQRHGLQDHIWGSLAAR